MDLAGLFLWSFLAATLIPLGSEPALAAIVSSRGSVALPVVIASLGNYLGACTTYLIALTAASRLSDSRAEKAARLVRRYGAPALLLSWVPIIGDAIVAAAGAARIQFVPFSVWTLIGKTARYLLLALTVDAVVR